jgi:hypothetical protein
MNKAELIGALRQAEGILSSIVDNGRKDLLPHLSYIRRTLRKADRLEIVYILEAEHKEVPGRYLAAFSSKASALAGKRNLREKFGRELEYVNIEPVEVQS